MTDENTSVSTNELSSAFSENDKELAGKAKQEFDAGQYDGWNYR